MAFRHEFAINELNKAKAHKIIDAVNSLAPGTVNRVCTWGPSDPVVRVGAVANNQSQMNIFNIIFKIAMQSTLLRAPEIDTMRPRLEDMHIKVRCQTGKERRAELAREKK